MTALATPNEVAAHLSKLARDLDAVTKALEVADLDAVRKREDATLALSRAFLSAEGSVEQRKHEAITRTHAERLAAETAEAVVRGMRRQIDSLRVRIDVGRSVGSALRAELASLGGGS
jgi:hypothetical protein